MKGCFQVFSKTGRQRYGTGLFIPKALIVKVERAENIEELFKMYVLNSDPYDRTELYLEFKVICELVSGSPCKCSSHEPYCKCYPDIFPLYAIHIHTPRSFSYVVHPNEKEHMERYLAGTDDALYDFVHFLRYLPSAAISEVSRAAQDFEALKKL